MRVLCKLLFVVFALPLVWSCDPLEQPKIIQQSGATFNSPPSNIVLNIDDADELIVFNVNPADFGTTVDEVTYIIQVDAVGNNFAAPLDIGSSTTTTVEVKVSELNRRALAKGLEPEVAGDLEFRVKATPTRSIPDVNGPGTAISVTAYSTDVELPSLRIPGDYQSWNPANDNTVIFSINSDDVYEGFVHILTGSGEFKFITGPEWDEFPDYGVGATAGSLVEKGGNIKIPGQFGTYKVKADLENLTYELERIGIWGIIGDATAGGWDTETPMTFNAAENVLNITTALSVGKMKFRTHTWDQNYGKSDEDGVAEDDGEDFEISEAGDYTIVLDFKTPGKVLYTITKK
ncbi:SusE domain-containing protein [Belliella marina]|uniref:SusE domain-containing protein n=1 Tax=Belliella marina TaxID=1644146 RepID=A0ABW4VTJ0_9BACT